MDISNRQNPLFTPAPGFTLVELLVVLTLTTLLLALGFPAVRKAQLDALASASAGNLRQLALANLTYAADNGRFAPADDQANNRRWHGARKSPSTPFDPSEGFLSPYLGKSRTVGICPVLKQMLKEGESFEEGTGGYGYNASYVGGTPAWSWNPDGTRVSARLSDILQPTNTVMFASTAYANGDHLQEYPYTEPPFWDFGDGPTSWRPSPTTHFRFRGRALVAWCDGHVSFVEPQERSAGNNPHGGDSLAQHLGWFGPDENNGYWNPRHDP